MVKLKLRLDFGKDHRRMAVHATSQQKSDNLANARLESPVEMIRRLKNKACKGEEIPEHELDINMTRITQKSVRLVTNDMSHGLMRPIMA